MSSVRNVSIGLRKLSFRNCSSNKAFIVSSGESYFSSDKPQIDGARWISSGRSQRGLYNGKDIRSGNNVSFSERKTKRKFKPNVFKKRVYSETLDEMVRFHLTASTLRSIDKAGGLDNYILTSKHIVSGEGLAVKERILKKIREKECMEKNRAFQRQRSLMQKQQTNS